MSRTRLPAALAAAAVSLVAVPGAASAAPAATLDRACYAHLPAQGSQPIIANLTGGTPGAGFVFAATGPGKPTGSAGSAAGTFDAAGNATARIDNVAPPSGTTKPTQGQRIYLSVTDSGAGNAVTPVGTALVTNLAITVSSKPRNPRSRRLVRVSGGSVFAGQSLYGFVVKPGSAHVLRRVRLGKGNACGYVSRRAVVAPGSYRSGSYRLYVNVGRTLRKSRAIGYAFRISRF
jgi:hypothetical protein